MGGVFFGGGGGGRVGGTPHHHAKTTVLTSRLPGAERRQWGKVSGSDPCRLRLWFSGLPWNYKVRVQFCGVLGGGGGGGGGVDGTHHHHAKATDLTSWLPSPEQSRKKAVGKGRRVGSKAPGVVVWNYKVTVQLCSWLFFCFLGGWVGGTPHHHAKTTDLTSRLPGRSRTKVVGKVSGSDPCMLWLSW